MKKIILGFTGEMVSGKGTAAKYVTQKYKCNSYRYSTILRNVLDRLYLEQSRDNMQDLSTILRRTFGEDLLAKIIGNEVKDDKNEVVVVEGIRREDDIKYLRGLPNFNLVYIEASLERRFERLKKREENPDDKSKTLEEFKRDHEQESELQIKGLKAKADFVLDNAGTTEELYAQIDSIIKEC